MDPRDAEHLKMMKDAGNVRLVMDVSAEDSGSQSKLRYAWYSSVEEAQAQAEHEMGTKDARDRLRAHYGKDDLELHPSGIQGIGIEDADGKRLWSPPKSHTSKFAKA